MPPYRRDDGLEDEVRAVLSLIRSNASSNSSMSLKLDELSRKADNIPGMLGDLERRQQAALEALRRDFERMFVSHAEYDPKHQFVLDKLREYDSIIAAGRDRTEEYVTLKAEVKQNTLDIKEMQALRSGALTRIGTWVGLVGGLIAIGLTLYQHIHLFP